jgi:serine/threonine-protein kinase RsbW
MPMPKPRRPPAPALAAALNEASAALDAFCAREGLVPDFAWRLRLALDEIVSNIVTHGGAGGEVPGVRLSFRRDGSRIEVTIADEGPPFDPLAHPAPDVTLPLEAREPGGLGIALVRALFDEVTYERTSHNNVLTLRTTEPGGQGSTRGTRESDADQSEQ